MTLNNKFLVATAVCFFMSGLPLAAAEAQEDEQTVVPVNAATKLIIYEQTGDVYGYVFGVPSVAAAPREFFTPAGEKYTVSLTGFYLKIKSYRDRGLASPVGGNIVAVKLDGLLGFPNGLWASSVASYKLGDKGVAGSALNALGSDSARGPYDGAYGTYLGDGDSEIVLGFSTARTDRSELLVVMSQINAKIEDLKKQLTDINNKTSGQSSGNAPYWLRPGCGDGSSCLN